MASQFSISYLDGDSKSDRVTLYVDREKYADYLKKFESDGKFMHQGNLITKADMPRFRTYQKAAPLAALAEGMFFNNREQGEFNLKVLSLNGRWLKRHPDKRLHPSLIWYVKDFIHTTMHSSYRWNAEFLFDLIESCYEQLQQYNQPNIEDKRNLFPDGVGRFVAPTLRREFAGNTEMIKEKWNRELTRVAE